MAAVEAGQDEEGSAKERRSPRVAAHGHPFVCEVTPLAGLQRQKGRPANNGEEEENPEPDLIPVLDRRQRFHHCDAAADQQKRHERSEPDTQCLQGVRPVWAAGTERAIAREQPAKRHGVASEEYPHAELAPALGRER